MMTQGHEVPDSTPLTIENRFEDSGRLHSSAGALATHDETERLGRVSFPVWSQVLPTQLI